jgi:hypothetical protein
MASQRKAKTEAKRTTGAKTKRTAPAAPRTTRTTRTTRMTKAKPAPQKERAADVLLTKKVAHSSPLVVRLREICMALPEVTERLSHGEPTWFAGKGRSFATLDNHHHGAPHLSVWLPQPLGVQQMLLEADSERFFRPPYVGVSGWIGVVLDTKPNWTLVASLVRDAYLHVATQKLAKELKKSEQP